MEDPNWHEYGFIGGLIVGGLWAIKEIFSLERRRKVTSEDDSKRVTPRDVRDEVVAVREQVKRLSDQFEDLKDAILRNGRYNGK